jgi:prepilin-type N-terminal cleavage/methylation domain-containing protein
MKRGDSGRRGFTILELLMAMGIFLIICAAMFELLNLSQKKYSSETQLTAAYQDGRLAMDQIVRDVNISGYPPQDMFTNPSDPTVYAVSPVAWTPNYPGIPCQIPSSCITPGDYGFIVETNFGSGVYWIRYLLQGTTLYRGVLQKQAGVDPYNAFASTPGLLTPFLENVMNNPGSAQLGQIIAQYPSMFPNGQPVPVFQYSCDTPGGPTPTAACALAGSYNLPKYIRDIDITLIVMTPQRDLQTQSLKLVELNGRGHRLNPVN